jgi:sulfur carrier protein
MIRVNGEPASLAEDCTVARLLEQMGVQASRGVAVAIDGEVVPRREWPERWVTDGVRVEVLTAMQGG